MFKYLYDTYGFIIMVTLSVLFLIFLLIYNIASGKTGSFDNHMQFVWSLLTPGSPVVPDSSQQYDKPISMSKGEAECRRVAEKITGKPFSKARPSFLKNEITGSNLELDCFNPELKIAIEYNGRQHYEFVPIFHESKEAFYNLKYRDEMKQRKCFENGVSLIVVPYTIPLGKIENYLTSQFRALSF